MATAMAERKMFVKRSDATVRDGTAGCEIICVAGRKVTEDAVMLNVYLADLNGGLAGPYRISEFDTEIRTIESQ